MAEAEELFEEVLSSTEALSEAELGADLEVTVESGEVGEEVISMADDFDEVLGNINEDYFAEFLSQDAELAQGFDAEVSQTVERSVAEFTESGAGSEIEAGIDAGTELSQGGAIQRAGADSVAENTGLWQKIKKIGGYAKKIVEAYILVDFVGKMIVEIVSAIEDSTKNPPWKGSLSKEQKEQLIKLQDAASSLKNILQGWEKGLEPLEKDPYFQFGTMKTQVGGRDVTVQVIDVVAYLLQDSLDQLKTANDLVKNGVQDLTVFDLTQLSNCVFTSFSDAQGIIDLRNNKGGIVTNDMLETMKFPPKADDTEVNRVLLQDFPEWKEKVQNQGFNLAKFGAKMAITAFTKSQVIMKVNEFLRKNIYPKVKQAAADAGQKAAKDYVSGEKGTIIAKALIPIVGPEKAREYGKEVQKKAMEKGKEAAQTAASAKANELKKDIEAQLKPVVQQLMDANKDQMKMIGKYAAQQILNAVVPPDSKANKPLMLFSLPPGVAHADIGHVDPKAKEQGAVDFQQCVMQQRKM